MKWLGGVLGCGVAVLVVGLWWAKREGASGVRKPIGLAAKVGDAAPAETLRLPAAFTEPRQSADLTTEQTEPLQGAPDRKTWLPAPPDQSIAGMDSTQILALYWGEQWPEIEAFLKSGGIKLYDLTWVAEPGRRLGDLDTALEAIKRSLMTRCTSAELLGFQALDTGFASDVLDDLDDVAGSARRVFNERAIELKVPGIRLPPAKLAESAERIAELVAPRKALLAELVAAARNAVEVDLRPVDRYTRPARGYLNVSPALCWGPRDAAQRIRDEPSRWCVTLGGSSKPHGAYRAFYVLYLTDDPTCARIIEQLVSYEATIEHSLELEQQWWIDNAEVMDH